MRKFFSEDNIDHKIQMIFMFGCLLLALLVCTAGCTTEDTVQNMNDPKYQQDIPCTVYDLQEVMSGKFSAHYIYLQDEKGSVRSFRICPRDYADIKVMYKIGDKVTVCYKAKESNLNFVDNTYVIKDDGYVYCYMLDKWRLEDPKDVGIKPFITEASTETEIIETIESEG